jgi:hypothetical protein
MFEYLRLERQKELEPLRARRIKNLNHEGHEGHEEKGNEVFIFLLIFLILTIQLTRKGFTTKFEENAKIKELEPRNSPRTRRKME